MTNTLTNAQRQELKDAFDVFDSDGSGKISARELGNIFKALNIKVNDHGLKHLMNEMDTDRSGQIEFEEFSRVMAATYFKKYSEDELRAAFRQFDEDGSGYIQSSELEHIMRKMGRHFTNEQIDAMAKALDTSGDGKIGFDEFVQLF
ncbi:unnamed protein product [Rotaria magnacalcarata]|uniref:EF-hand domain-containing protein n=2 Tax=Rotaria magnacalcarata TaxID=392030 RepID=A0A816LQY6_9BILA|nr:unnamed protein product [Rotaria magnacalcarata]CAF1936517.1 unnamed protein product [Rotaria magnacalcarata]CAF2055409.1 unnamed protein product [Rotaria magnacalcarata]CAF2066860.1 unnamed protein product [Rotaria magnacalcarata]CAF3889916.1 unnamed protein product [Rotaria magnacalcarata]